MIHSNYEAMFRGFNDKLNDISSNIDDYNEMDGRAYENGRFLALLFTLESLDHGTVNVTNIIRTYNQYKRELYNGGKRRRTRN